MQLLRRKQEMMPQEQYHEAAGVLGDLFNEAIRHEPEAAPVEIEDLLSTVRDAQLPEQHGSYMTTLSGNFLPSHPESRKPVQRATGKEALISLELGQDVSGATTDALHYALLNLDATQGRFRNEVYRIAMAEAGIPWEYNGCRRRLIALSYDENSGDYVFEGAISDNHPVNQFDIYCKPNPYNDTEFNYTYTLTREVVEDQMYYLQTGKWPDRLPNGELKVVNGEVQYVESDLLREGRFTPFTPADALEAIHVMSLIDQHNKENPNNQIDNPDDLPGKNGISASALHQYRRMFVRDAKDPFVANFAYRAAQLYDSLIKQSKSYGKRFDQLDDKVLKHITSKIYEAFACQTARARFKRITTMGRGLIGSIGLLDPTDPSMKFLTQTLTDSLKKSGDFNPEDPTQMAMLEGAIVFDHVSMSAPGGNMIYKRLGGPEQQLKGITPLMNIPQDDYAGFERWIEVIDEWKSGKIEGKPKMPGVVGLIQTPKAVTEAGVVYKSLLILDLDEAPGVITKWFNNSPVSSPWEYRGGHSSYQRYTLREILQGRYNNQQAPALMKRIARISHVVVGMSGDVTNAKGQIRGFNIEQTMGAGQGFELDAPMRVTDTQTGDLVSLQPADVQSAITGPKIKELAPVARASQEISAPPTRKDVSRYKKGAFVPMALPPHPGQDRARGEARVLSGFVDANGRVALNKLTKKRADEIGEDIESKSNGQYKVDTPLASVVVMSH